MIQNDILLHEIFMCKEVSFNQLKKKNSNNYKLTFKLFKYNFVFLIFFLKY